jgi:hypothetical protein
MQRRAIPHIRVVVPAVGTEAIMHQHAMQLVLAPAATRVIHTLPLLLLAAAACAACCVVGSAAAAIAVTRPAVAATTAAAAAVAGTAVAAAIQQRSTGCTAIAVHAAAAAAFAVVAAACPASPLAAYEGLQIQHHAKVDVLADLATKDAVKALQVDDKHVRVVIDGHLLLSRHQLLATLTPASRHHHHQHWQQRAASSNASNMQS